MRLSIGAHSKTPQEILYLELETIPLRSIINIRRILYFQNIMTRSDRELISRVYNAQKANPVWGDWVTCLKEDLNYLGEEVIEEKAKTTSEVDYKKTITDQVGQKVFEDLKKVKSSHNKVKHICYHTFKTQEYMKSNSLTNQEISLLFSLRSRIMRSIVNNFERNIICSLGCLTPKDQEH